MNVIDMLREADGGAGLQALASQFGLSAEQTEAVVGNVVPEMMRRIERNTLSRGGVADLVAMMGAVGAGGISNPQAVGTEIGRFQGNALLEQVFGTADKSRAVAAKASYASGIGDSIIKAMLPYIASMVINSIFKRTSGGLGDILSKIPNMGGGGGAPAGYPRGGGGIDEILNRIPNIGGGGMGGGGPVPSDPGPGGGFGAPSQAPSKGGGGGFGLPQSQGGGFGLPGPEGMGRPGPINNPYGELSDVIRRGGEVPGTGGGALWKIVRGALGGALGFQSRGVMSWIFRMVVMRFGWSILRTVLRRMFMGR